MSNFIEEAEELKRIGNELFKKKQYVDALKKYKKATKTDPQNAIYWSNIAACYDILNDFGESKAAAEKCIQLDPSFIKGYYRLATAQGRINELEDALKTITKGLELEPKNRDLLEKRENIRFKLDRYDKFEEATLPVPQTDFEYFGGGRQQSNIPQNTHYYKMKRRALPPYSKKQKGISYQNEQVKQAFDCFCNGDLFVKWFYEFGHDHKMLELHGYLPHDNVHPVICTIYRVNGTIALPHTPTSSCHPVYSKILAFDDQLRLGMVLMQRFLRVKGSSIASPDPGIIRMISVDMTKKFREQLESYKDAADIRFVCADILYHHGPKEMFLQHVAYLGEALESAKEYHEAAQIYLDAADGKLGRHTLCPEDIFRGFAAVAFKRNMEYIKAEHEYFGALRLAGENWHFRTCDESHVVQNLANMMTLYEEVATAVDSQVFTDEAHQNMRMARFILTGLLGAAGYNGPPNSIFRNPRDIEECLKLLRPEYVASQQQAWKAVITALATSSVQEFHRVILGCKDPATMILTSTNGSKEDFLKQQKKNAKSIARQLGLAINIISPDIYRCDNCQNQFQKVMYCPCRAVRYCSKECQVAHYPYHKKTCTLKR